MRDRKLGERVGELEGDVTELKRELNYRIQDLKALESEVRALKDHLQLECRWVVGHYEVVPRQDDE